MSIQGVFIELLGLQVELGLGLGLGTGSGSGLVGLGLDLDQLFDFGIMEICDRNGTLSPGHTEHRSASNQHQCHEICFRFSSYTLLECSRYQDMKI